MSRRGAEREALWDDPQTTVRDGSGPVRVVTNEPDPDYKPHPVGFAPISDGAS